MKKRKAHGTIDRLVPAESHVATNDAYDRTIGLLKAVAKDVDLKLDEIMADYHKAYAIRQELMEKLPPQLARYVHNVFVSIFEDVTSGYRKSKTRAMQVAEHLTSERTKYWGRK